MADTVEFGNIFFAWPMRLFQVLALLSLVFVERSFFGVLWCLLLVAFEVQCWCAVQAFADVNGVTYRRWTTWKQVPWQELSPPKKQRWAWYLSVSVLSAPALTRHLLLPYSGNSLSELQLSNANHQATRDLLQYGTTGRTN